MKKFEFGSLVVEVDDDVFSSLFNDDISSLEYEVDSILDDFELFDVKTMSFTKSKDSVYSLRIDGRKFN